MEYKIPTIEIIQWYDITQSYDIITTSIRLDGEEVGGDYEIDFQ